MKSKIVFILLTIVFLIISLLFLFTDIDERIQWRIKHKRFVSKNEKLDLDTFQLIIDSKKFDKLKQTRDTCLLYGYIGNDIPNPYHSAQIKFKGEIYNCKIRFKGDFLDHLSHPEKWSYKVKLKDNKKIMGLSEFAIQRPGVRNGYGEFLYHKLLKELEFKYLFYDFVDVTLNDEHHGIYAVEGRFNDDFYRINKIDKQPIIRFNDEHFFNHKRKIYGRARNEVNWNDWSTYSSQIDCYDIKDFIKDSVLKHNLELGVSKLEKFRKGDLKAIDVFDLDQLATFYAISDLFGAYHAQQFPNLRYYFNSENKLLEPIGYDANGLSNNDIFFANELQFYGTPDYDYKGRRFEHRLNWLLLDPTFLEKYHKKLLEVSDTDFINKVFKSIDINKTKDVANHLDFNFNQIYENQKTILASLDAEHSLQVNLIKEDDSTLIFNVVNVDYIGTELLNIVNDKNQIVAKPKLEKYVFGRMYNQHSAFNKIIFNKTLDYSDLKKLKVNYKIIGLDRIYSATINLWNNNIGG